MLPRKLLGGGLVVVEARPVPLRVSDSRPVLFAAIVAICRSLMRLSASCACSLVPDSSCSPADPLASPSPLTARP